MCCGAMWLMPNKNGLAILSKNLQVYCQACEKPCLLHWILCQIPHYNTTITNYYNTLLRKANFSVLLDTETINALQAAWKEEICAAICTRVVFSFTDNLLFKKIGKLGLDQRVITMG